MKKILLITLFAILQTNSFARNCSFDNDRGSGHEFGHSGTCPSNWASACASYPPELKCYYGEIPTGQYTLISATCGGFYNKLDCRWDIECCTDQCAADSIQCNAPNVWNSETCSCNPPPPPPCQRFLHCETYFNTGFGLNVSLGSGIGIDTNYTGPGYYAMRLSMCDTCSGVPHCDLMMDVPGTCEQHGFCPPGALSCDSVAPGGSSSSAGSSSSSYEPPDCVCMGCFGGSCMVTCSDGSNRTCVGDFENCTELKKSPTWTECTAPNSSPSSSGAGSSAAGSSASPSSQDNAIDGLNALIDTVHHSNELQEVGHGIMRDGIEQNKNFFDDVRGFFGGLMSQITGIFSNTDNISKNTNNINKGVNNIANKLDSIKNRPRDTTIVNVAGDTINITGDTNIINIPIDSSIGEPWDTSGGLVGMLTGAFDSTLTGLDTMPNWDTIHRGSVDSIGRGITAVWDSGAGKFYKDTLGKWMSSGIQNSTLSGTGSNSCPAFLTSSYVINIGSISVDLTRNVKLGQYLCTPVFGGRTGWELGRTLLRIIVAIGCMFFLFKCATGTIGGDE